MKNKFLFWVIVVSGLISQRAFADRFNASLGIAVAGGQSVVGINAEYEYTINKLWGLGAAASYLVSNPPNVLIAAPGVYLHPFLNGITLSASPVLAISTTTQLGVQLGAKLPIQAGAINIMPVGSVSIFASGPIYSFGLGISI